MYVHLNLETKNSFKLCFKARNSGTKIPNYLLTSIGRAYARCCGVLTGQAGLPREVWSSLNK